MTSTNETSWSPRGAHVPLREALLNIATGLLSAGAALAVGLNMTFVEFPSSHFLVVLACLLSLHAFCFHRLMLCREYGAYAGLVAYMFIALLWTRDTELALNTLFPSVAFLLVLLLFGAIFGFHNLRAATVGTLVGMVIAAAIYMSATGFPFGYPRGFSYNAVAGMYLFGLFAALLLAVLSRSRVFALAIALAFLLHVGATTSIKTNLGVVIGAISAATLHFTQFMRMLLRNLISIVVALGVIVFAVASNDAVVERVQAGVQRVAFGLEVLRVGTDTAAYTGFDQRQYWMRQGLEAWFSNPVFGHGVEAFRSDYGITSHSTPVDLLYNTGLIGFLLFYSIFVSLAWRLFAAQRPQARDLRALVLAFLLCNLFVTLSGIIFYQASLAAFIGISAALLRRAEKESPAGRGGPESVAV